MITKQKRIQSETEPIEQYIEQEVTRRVRAAQRPKSGPDSTEIAALIVALIFLGFVVWVVFSLEGGFHYIF